MSNGSNLQYQFEIKNGTKDAEQFIQDVKGEVSAISAEIDHSQTRREAARQKGWEYAQVYEKSYEDRLRKEIQQNNYPIPTGVPVTPK